MQRADALDEQLFALLMLGDDRCVAETHRMGERRHARDAVVSSAA
jgi:hypothetical protein